MSENALATLDRMRGILRVALFVGFFGTLADLWFIGHHEDWKQIIPLGVLGVGLASLAASLVFRGALAVRVFQGAMAALLAASLAGVYFHFTGNREFQLELDPTLSGLGLVRKVLEAKAPPTLAPGSLLQLALIGFAYAYRHPGLTRTGDAAR